MCMHLSFGVHIGSGEFFYRLHTGPNVPFCLREIYFYQARYSILLNLLLDNIMF